MLPSDVLLVYGLEEHIKSAGRLFEPLGAFENEHSTQGESTRGQKGFSLEDCELRGVRIRADHPFAGYTLRECGLRDQFHCVALAIVRSENRIKNPSSDFTILPDDELYVVGPGPDVERLSGMTTGIIPG